MKASRYFVFLFCVAVVAFLTANFFLWNLWVEDLRTAKYAGGDLARMGYLPGSKMPRQYANNFEKRHLEFSDYQDEKIDIVTIGDSFSNPAGLGENIYYQDHLSSKYDVNILNISPKLSVSLDPVTIIIKLLNSGEFDRIAPRYLVLESSGRLVMERLGQKLDFDLCATEGEIESLANSSLKTRHYQPKFFDFISEANFKFLLNQIYYLFNNNNTDNTVFITPLNRDYFTVKSSDILAYYHDDTYNIKEVTPESMQVLNKNLNALSDLLAVKGITLIFMPIVDKFDLYRDYVLEDSLPHNPLFDYFRPLEKRYLFMDTKAILAPAVARGEKDIFFADDTHWTANACHYLVPHFGALMPELTRSEGMMASLRSEAGE